MFAKLRGRTGFVRRDSFKPTTQLLDMTRPKSVAIVAVIAVTGCIVLVIGGLVIRWMVRRRRGANLPSAYPAAAYRDPPVVIDPRHDDINNERESYA